MLVGVATWGVLSVARAWSVQPSGAWWRRCSTWCRTWAPIVTAGGLALVAFLQFGSFGMAALIGGVSMLINTLEGNLLTPWLTGARQPHEPGGDLRRRAAFGWLWGIWGLLLGTPLVMVAKSICDHVDDLQPMGELLGE